jgi:hypothetical protein
MAENIPRLPLQFEKDQHIRLWFAKVLRRVYADNVFPWITIDFTGANITDIETRNENDLQQIVLTKDADYTLDLLDGHIIGDTSAGNVEFFLPASPGDGSTKRITKLVNANIITITPNGAEDINGEADAIMYFKGSSFTLQAIVGGWRVI